MARRSFARRITAWLALATLAFVLLTAAPVIAMRWVDPWTSAFMLDARKDALLARDFAYRNRYQWRDLEQISPHLALAVLASEDQLFPFHAGFDFRSIREAVRANERNRGNRVRGASTISQQVAKNLFLWPERSWFRKGLEAWFTVLIEAFWPKERILEIYLNIAEMGRGIYGAEAAARHYWGKTARRLTRSESALIAAALPNPKIYKVDRPSRFLLRRRDWILGQMQALGGPSYLAILDDPNATATAEEKLAKRERR